MRLWLLGEGSQEPLWQDDGIFTVQWGQKCQLEYSRCSLIDLVSPDMFIFVVNDNTVNLNETVAFTFGCFFFFVTRLIHLREAKVSLFFLSWRICFMWNVIFHKAHRNLLYWFSISAAKRSSDAAVKVMISVWPVNFLSQYLINKISLQC